MRAAGTLVAARGGPAGAGALQSPLTPVLQADVPAEISAEGFTTSGRGDGPIE